VGNSQQDFRRREKSRIRKGTEERAEEKREFRKPHNEKQQIWPKIEPDSSAEIESKLSVLREMAQLFRRESAGQS